MATFLEDFEAQTIGSFPSGWTSRWATFAATVENGGAGAGRVLNYQVTTAGRRVATLNAAGSFADGEVLVKFRITSPATSSTYAWIHARAAGAAASETAISCAISNDASNVTTIILNQYSGGTSTALGSAAISSGVVIGAWYWCRFKFTGGAVGGIQAKVWADGASEPGSWTVSNTTVATVTSAGAAGVGAVSGNGSTNVKADSVGVATTAAETAPAPTISKTATITLVDASGAPVASATGLRWAWFDTSDVSAFGTATDKGTTASTNGSGVMVVPLANTTLAVGVSGSLVIQTGDGLSAGVYVVVVAGG